MDGRPISNLAEVQAYEKQFVKARDIPVSVPCITNPKFANEGTCIDAPEIGDSCDVINAPARCRKCLGRVLLGERSELVAEFNQGRGFLYFALALLLLIFVPIGICTLRCAFPELACIDDGVINLLERRRMY